MPVSKKIFIISAIILGILLIFLGIYQLNFKKGGTSNDSAATENTSAGAISKVNQGKITEISAKKVFFPVIDFNNSQIQYYSKETGMLSQMNLDGSGDKKLSPKSLPNLANVIWAPNGAKAILETRQSDGSSYDYYNRAEDKIIPIKNIDTIVWQNINKIFYKYYDTKTQDRSLNIASPDGSDWLKITDIAYKKADLAPIPKSGLVSIWNSADALTETLFESVAIAGGERKSLFTGKFGADYLWNGNGDTFLISHSDQKGGAKIQLAIANEQGGEYRNLSIGTFVSKCVWSNDNVTVFCAVPDTISGNVVLPNDYNTGKVKTKDSFWKINTKTGEKSSLVNPAKIPTEIDASNLFINDQETMLIFLNKLDNKLYKLEL
jgi:hypothetical protein